MDTTSLIVNDLNKNKIKNIDLWTFINVGEILIDELIIQMGDEEGYLQTLQTEAATIANVGPGPIVLIILELKNQRVTLDRDLFLKNIVNAGAEAAVKNKPAASTVRDNLSYESVIQQLNHIILSKSVKEGMPVYNLIGYTEKSTNDEVVVNLEGDKLQPKVERPSRKAAQPKECLSFKLQKTTDKCTVLPELIKSKIYPFFEYYYGGHIPQSIRTYYGTRQKEDIEVMEIDAAQEDQDAEAEASQEVLEEDKCNFKKLAMSKIKNNENYDYCKITDNDLLLKIQENINISGLNGLIKSKLDLKKLDDDKKIKEEELQNKEFSKRNATPVKGWNEMFMISKQVLLKNAGKTYSSRDFFVKYLDSDVLDVDKLFDEIKTEDIMS